MSAKSLSSRERAEIWTFAERLADRAGQIALLYFRNVDLGVENKRAQDFDPVTVADREIEAALREMILAERPEDGILGEEFPPKETQNGWTWVLDPIDGTRAFISGAPSWGTLIALSNADGVALGLIDQPYIGERFMGGLNRAELCRGSRRTPFACRKTDQLADAILFSTFPEIGTATERAAFDRVAANTRLTRYGLDCYAYGLLATAQIDLVIEAGLSAYDIQGPIGVVEAAGGIVTSWDGGPAMGGGQVIAAANAQIHQQALSWLGQAENT